MDPGGRYSNPRPICRNLSRRRARSWPGSMRSAAGTASGGKWRNEYDPTMANPFSRITIQPEQCHGQPCIRGLRIRVSDILEMLASEMTQEQILKDYPYLEAEDISAALAY